MRMLKIGLVLLLALLAGCATGGRKMTVLQEMQYAYSAAIRWGDFEGAWQLVDPDYRKANPMTDLQFERYKQIQVSGYSDLATQVGDGTAKREIQIGVINRNTMAERSIRYTEQWRYDVEAKKWWVTGGLPDFWAGQ
ncbi:MAG: hypothetical protein LH470_01350 [Lysobacter sp.]|nr:hypothetical protein [Lysobacter sp.]